MKSIQTDVLVIGAGLTGLLTARRLKQRHIKVAIVEARSRPGGRIHTLEDETRASVEMGATWLGKKHTRLMALLQELDIGVFEQKMGERAIYEPISTSPPQLAILPPNTDPSYRISGGSSHLIKCLVDGLEEQDIHYSTVVRSIQRESEGVVVKTDAESFHASVVVSTLPPYLLMKSIDLTPALPEGLTKIALQTHTWMGDSIKVGLTYAQPFWRSANSSGTIVSNVGPIPEMYDHSNEADDRFALKGFLNGNYFSVSKGERLEMVLRQLSKYYGSVARNFSTYEECVWRSEPFTFSPYDDHILPHQNNGHELYRKPYWDGRLFLAGAETADAHPGYMDGAVRSADWVSAQSAKYLLG
ncbi:MAG: FAD-dependent oxidoreductase [Bacteroidota bacterium]